MALNWFRKSLLDISVKAELKIVDQRSIKYRSEFNCILFLVHLTYYVIIVDFPFVSLSGDHILL